MAYSVPYADRRPLLGRRAEPAQALAQYEAAARVGRPKVVAVDDVQPTTRSRDEHFEHGKGDLLLDRLALDGYMVDIYDTEPGYRMAVARR